MTSKLQPGSESRKTKSWICAQSLDMYLVSLWIFVSCVNAQNLPYLIGPTVLDTVHSALLVLSYSFFYLMPVLLVSWLLRQQIRLRLVVVLLLSAITIASLFADSRLFGLYGFHFNGFVWNLITTPGGLASLGADQVNPLSVFKLFGFLVAGLGACLLINRFSPYFKLRWRWIVLGFFAVTLPERIIYSLAYAELYAPVMSQSDYMFLYQPLTMNSFLEDLGYGVILQDGAVDMDAPAKGTLHYPLQKLRVEKVDSPPNILFLVAESLRYSDVYNARVMPRSIAFAREHGVTFSQHISGGNGTRQALFAMFYGLYGNYWDLFLRERVTPVLFDVLDQYAYQHFLYTSSYFTYPEFDQTIFGSVPSSSMTETNDGEAWTRDKRNVEMLLQDITQRDKDLPFMGFAFFEATHARYSFPEEGIIEKDYLPELDYTDLKRDELLPMMAGMKARYLNSAHFVDQQFGLIYDYLLANDLLKDTIVIVTGDHGEEFLEKERWGHNSSFVDEQVRVPLIISHPDFTPAEVSSITSHMDIPGMLLTTLGVTNPVSDYSLGNRLLDAPANKLAVVASWTDLGIVSEKGKLVIPFRSTTQHRHLAMDSEDNPMDLGALSAQLTEEIATVINNSRKFVSKD